MEIVFNEDKRIFHLYNNKISYCFSVSAEGILQHLYFGARIKEVSVQGMASFGGDWSAKYFDLGSCSEKDYADHFMCDRSLVEIASHGAADKRGAPIIIEDENGTSYTNLRYVSHKIYSGKPRLSGLPCSHCKDAKTVELRLQDLLCRAEVLLCFTITDGFSGIIRNVNVTNCSKEPLKLRRCYTMQLDIPCSNFNLIHFHGDWAHEMKKCVTEANDGLLRVASNHGRSSHEENPFCMLASRDATEDYGEVYGFNLLYSSNFALDVFVDKWNSTRVMQGIADEDFCFRLLPEETFIAPESIVGYSDCGFGELSRNLHDFVRECVIPSRFNKQKQAILLNSWEGCYFQFDTEKICGLIRNAKQWGAEIFCLDDGWFSTRNHDDSGLGDWTINTEKVDFGIIERVCKEENIVFGLWFEPEMINYNSKLYREHPEYCLGVPNVERTLWRHQLALDMANDEVIENIFAQISDILDKYDIGYVKWDNNKTLTDMFSPSCSRQGEAYHKVMLGVYKLIEKLTERYPNILFEGCASGGGRFDLGILSYFPQIQGSDEMNPLVRMFMQYSYSFGYPISTVGYHVNNSPVMSYSAKAKLALFGTYGLELNPALYGENDRKQIEEINEIFHKYHFNTVEKGDLYRLYDPNETNYMSMICVSKNKSQALMIFTGVLGESPRFRFVKIKGLNAKKTYRNSLDGAMHSGEYYMKVGLNLNRGLRETECMLITFDEEE